MPVNFKACLIISLSILFSGCADITVFSIEDSISDNDLVGLEKYKDHPYVASYEEIPEKYYYHSNAMESAIQQRSLPAVKKLVELGANRNVAYRYLMPPSGEKSAFNVSSAELACAAGTLNITDYLLQQFPEETVDYSRCFFAYYFLDKSWLVAMLNAFESRDEFYAKRPHLQRNLESNHINHLRELIKRGADVNRLEELFSEFNIDRPFRGIIIVNHRDIHSLNKIDMDVVDLLLESGYDSENIWKWMGPAIASDDKRKNRLALTLLEKGVDPNRSYKARIPATVENQDIHYEYRENFSFLHAAAFYGRSEIYRELLVRGANPAAVDSSGAIPMDYAGKNQLWADVKKQLELQKQAIANQQAAQQQSDNDFLGKALAIGLGAAAIGSTGVSSDVAIQAMGALTADVLQDTGGQNLQALHTDAQAALLTQQQAQFQAEVIAQQQIASTAKAGSSTSTGSSKKAIDCAYEFFKSRQRLLNGGGGKVACDEIRQNCLGYRAWVVNGEVNRRLASAGMAQCQVDNPKPTIVRDTTPSGSATQEK